MAGGSTTTDDGVAETGDDEGVASEERVPTEEAVPTDDSTGEGLLPLFDHTHDTGTTAIVVVFAAVLGLLSGWITADFGVRSIVFVVGAVGTGYLLYAQPSRSAVLAAGFYSMAALLAAAPFLYELGLFVNVNDPIPHLLSLADLIVFVVFWVVAAVPALVANRIANGPLVPRLRVRLER